MTGYRHVVLGIFKHGPTVVSRPDSAGETITAHYAHGELHGPFEKLSAEDLEIRGQFTHGTPTGVWQYSIRGRLEAERDFSVSPEAWRFHTYALPAGMSEEDAAVRCEEIQKQSLGFIRWTNHRLDRVE